MPWMLSADFLVAWGARWGPLMRRQPWRFVTSWFVHESFMHLLSNMLLFMVVASQARARARQQGQKANVRAHDSNARGQGRVVLLDLRECLSCFLQCRAYTVRTFHIPLPELIR